MAATKECNCAGVSIAAPSMRSAGGVIEINYVTTQPGDHEVYGKDTGVFYGVHHAGERFWVTARDQSVETKRFVRV
jgi:hypothetical protein